MLGSILGWQRCSLGMRRWDLGSVGLSVVLSVGLSFPPEGTPAVPRCDGRGFLFSFYLLYNKPRDGPSPKT